MAEAFVTLDKYKADLSRFSARDKLLIERLEDKLKSIDYRIRVAGDLACVGEKQIIEELLSLLRFPLDMWFTQQEWSHPVSVSRDKYSSVADGIQTHFEFEGER